MGIETICDPNYTTTEIKKQQEPQRVLISERSLLATIAYFGVIQAPKRYPRKLYNVINAMKAKIQNDFECNAGYFYCKEFDEFELREWLYANLFTIPEFQEWNLSENEYKNNVKVEDKNIPQFYFTSAYDNENVENDFIDLDACIRNIVTMLIKHSDI